MRAWKISFFCIDNVCLGAQTSPWWNSWASSWLPAGPTPCYRPRRNSESEAYNFAPMQLDSTQALLHTAIAAYSHCCIQPLLHTAIAAIAASNGSEVIHRCGVLLRCAIGIPSSDTALSSNTWKCSRMYQNASGFRAFRRFQILRNSNCLTCVREFQHGPYTEVVGVGRRSLSWHPRLIIDNARKIIQISDLRNFSDLEKNDVHPPPPPPPYTYLRGPDPLCVV